MRSRRGITPKLKSKSQIKNQEARIYPAALGALASVVATFSCIGTHVRPLSATLGGCTICHVDMADDLAGSKHEKAGIGCVTCHGHSKGHVEDENNEVKPDRLFARREIDRFCNGCHLATCPRAQTEERLPVGVNRKTCADCHGAHEVRIRVKS